MSEQAYITTVEERCRMCYTCVRECPVKAIRITEGQAQVIGDRCIACGNCVRVCSQNAKLLRSTAHEVRALLASGTKVAACLAPSFPAEFVDMDHTQMVGMLREIGFHLVVEVAFGADLVARQYWELLLSCNGNRYISTTCPAIVTFVERYYPDLVALAGPDRVADDRHGAGPARDLRQRTQDRVHRAVHRQEDGEPRASPSPARSTP